MSSDSKIQIQKPRILPVDYEQFREYLMSERRSYLDAVDRIERLLDISPTTAEIRRAARDGKTKDI